MLFNFMHPKPVGNRRPVAEMTVRSAQPATIAPGHVLVVQHGLAIDGAAPVPAAPPVSADGGAGAL